jgi:hypothetical protein
MNSWLVQFVYVLAVVLIDALLGAHWVSDVSTGNPDPLLAQIVCVLILLNALNHPRLLAARAPSDLNEPPRTSGSLQSLLGILLIAVVLMRVILLMSMFVGPALRGHFEPGTEVFKYLHSASALLLLLLECRMLGWLLVPRPIKQSVLADFWAHALHAVLTAIMLWQIARLPLLRDGFAHIHDPRSFAALLLALLLNLFWFVMIYLPIRLADLAGQLRRVSSRAGRAAVLLLAYALMIYGLRP